MTDDDSTPAQPSTVVNDETAGKGTETTRKVLLHETITQSIIDAFFAVYNKLDFGFLENVYCGALSVHLRRRGHRVSRQVAVPVLYDGVEVALYRMDFVVDDVVIVEVKSTERLNPSDARQVLNYLHATRFDVGLLLHFGPKPKFHRLVAPTTR